MYRVKVNKAIEKFLKRIPKDDAERIRNKILSLKDPFAAKPRKVCGEEDTYRVRVGDYRILFFIDFEQKIVFVSKVDKRGRVYKR
ncbi:type II toxin-antitoxin system RelE/ParE family toxin [Archaeoglobales archaeon]|nr:MAG: type II toxin-antitoxin system RelE/ParE family toxin [Archaeoglobales archaeon]